MCIPVSEFYKGKNGDLYCRFEVIERNQVGQFGDTHMVKQQLEKESYKALSEEQRKAIPILGSFKPSIFANIETVVAEEVKATQHVQTKPQAKFNDVPF